MSSNDIELSNHEKSLVRHGIICGLVIGLFIGFHLFLTLHYIGVF